MTDQETKVLELLRTHLITAEGRSYDHVATTFRWLMATLFAANGGAILAVFGGSQQSFKTGSTALVWFGAGVFLSILMGLLSSFWGHRASVRATTTRFRIDRALLDGAMDAGILTEISAQKPNWKTWVPSYVGITAFLCLSGGMFAIGRTL